MGKNTVMGLRMIQCGRQTVHVIQPDGQVRQFLVPIKVSDLTLLYPHHFVSHATTKRGSMLPLETQLETGTIYILLPFPRLFPALSPAVPHLCSCFLQGSPLQRLDFPGIGALKAELKRHWGMGMGGSFQSSKISPEEEGNGRKVSSPEKCGSSCQPRRVWEPDLDMILEDRALVLTKEEEAAALQAKKEKPKPKPKPCGTAPVQKPSVAASAQAAK